MLSHEYGEELFAKTRHIQPHLSRTLNISEKRAFPKNTVP